MGGGEMSHPIWPPYGIQWRSIPVRDHHNEDKLSGDIGLSFPRIDGTSPFIHLPRQFLLEIIPHVGLPAIYDALIHCVKLGHVALCQSDHKRVFTDYGKHVTYACVGVGPQPSRISNTVLGNPPFVDALPQRQWDQLVWLMKHAETSFSLFTDHCVISHLHHAKKLVPFKTFSSTVDKSSTLSSEFFWWDCIWFKCIPSLSHRYRLHNEHHRYSSKDDPNIKSTIMSLRIFVFLPWKWQFLFVQVITSCLTISSRCNMEDEIMCTSVYLKTVIVGMHNNDLKLTHKQLQVAHQLKRNTHK